MLIIPGAKLFKWCASSKTCQLCPTAKDLRFQEYGKLTSALYIRWFLQIQSISGWLRTGSNELNTANGLTLRKVTVTGRKKNIFVYGQIHGVLVSNLFTPVSYLGGCSQSKHSVHLCICIFVLLQITWISNRCYNKSKVGKVNTMNAYEESFVASSCIILCLSNFILTDNKPSPGSVMVYTFRSILLF